MVYNELCHKEIDWSKAMKQILITLVAVVLGITAMSSYAEKSDYTQFLNSVYRSRVNDILNPILPKRKPLDLQMKGMQ